MSDKKYIPDWQEDVVEVVSECCGVKKWLDIDICSHCKEHAVFLNVLTDGTYVTDDGEIVD